jgi:hypothetical protein
MIPSRMEDLAFSPAAISSVLEQPYEEGTGFNLNLRDNGQIADVPMAGDDPHTLVMQAQYGSILEQAMMSQSVVTGITETSGAISSSGMGTSYGNGFDQIYEEDEEDEVDDDEDLDETSRRDRRPRDSQDFGMHSALPGFNLAPEVSLGSMGGLSGLNTRANSPQERDGAIRFSEDSRRASVWSGPTQPTVFEKRPIPVNQGTPQGTPKLSALAMMLKPTEQDGDGPMGNPFARYVSVPPPSGSSVPSLDLEIYFPLSREPSKPLRVVVRKEVTVEELIGWSLHQYLEEDRVPGLEEGHERGPNRSMDPEVWYSTAGWALRMVEDDGEVDEDFPGKSSHDCTTILSSAYHLSRQRLTETVRSRNSLSVVLLSWKQTQRKVSAILSNVETFLTDLLKPHSRTKPYQAAYSTIWESDPADAINAPVRKRCLVADFHAYQCFGRTIFLGVDAGTACSQRSSRYILSKRLWRTQFFDEYCSSRRRYGDAQGSSHFGFGSTVQY